MLHVEPHSGLDLTTLSRNLELDADWATQVPQIPGIL